MKAFSFHIDTSAKFDRAAQRIRKSRLDLALQFRLPALKTRVAAAPKRQAVPRKAPAGFLHSPREILAARQSRYDDFVISTMQQRDGRWIAGFGCADGRALLVEECSQAVSTTNPYSAQSLALAEAQLRIDAARASRRTAAPHAQ